MASARNLCQHSDADGTQCTSNDYVLCPHCQLQLCLKHINAHQTLLRADLDLLCDQMNCVRANLDNLIFDSTDRRTELFQRLDDWYHERVAFLNRTYAEKKQQLHVLCIQASLEFDGYRAKKEKEFKENLSNQLRRVCRQKQIHIDDLNDMKVKLNTIERGLDELKQLLIDVQPVQASLDIQILKRRYVEAAKVCIMNRNFLSDSFSSFPSHRSMATTKTIYHGKVPFTRLPLFEKN